MSVSKDIKQTVKRQDIRMEMKEKKKKNPSSDYHRESGIQAYAIISPSINILLLRQEAGKHVVSCLVPCAFSGQTQ